MKTSTKTFWMKMMEQRMNVMQMMMEQMLQHQTQQLEKGK